MALALLYEHGAGDPNLTRRPTGCTSRKEFSMNPVSLTGYHIDSDSPARTSAPTVRWPKASDNARNKEDLNKGIIIDDVVSVISEMNKRRGKA